MTYHDTTTETDRWAEILEAAVKTPGLVLSAYSNFHNYSLGNQMAAIFQCGRRNITPGPIATYSKWQELGRQVRKGEKAIELCMPITCKRAKSEAEEDEGTSFTRFLWKRNWFVLAQTDGEEFTPEPIPDWDEARALSGLNIAKTDFDPPGGKP